MDVTNHLLAGTILIVGDHREEGEQGPGGPIQSNPNPNWATGSKKFHRTSRKKPFFFGTERRRHREFYCFHPEKPLTEMEVKGMSEPTEERGHFFKFVSERRKAFLFCFFPKRSLSHIGERRRRWARTGGNDEPSQTPNKSKFQCICISTRIVSHHPM